MDDWDNLKAELLDDPATAAAYDARRPAYELASKLIEMRTRLGLSQRQLASKAGMTQPEIARLESAAIQPTWETLARVLGAVGAEVAIKVRDEHGKLVRLSIGNTERPRRTARRERVSATVSAQAQDAS